MPFVMNVLLYVSLSSIPAYSAPHVYRETEVLYAKVAGEVDGDAEYFFLPHGSAAIITTYDYMCRGLSEEGVELHRKAMSRDPKPKKRNICAYEYAPHNSLKGYNKTVTKTRIIRVQNGETSEYFADVVSDGRCFDRVKLQTTTFHTRGEIEAEELALPVKQELEQICAEGFTALKPSPSLSSLNGVYIGERKQTRLEMKFRRGTVKDADLLAEKLGEADAEVMYYPLCGGVITIVNAAPDDQQSTSIVILEKSEVAKTQSLRKRLFSRRKSPKHAFDDYSRALCNVEEHGRRSINRTTLGLWDRGLPDEFVLKTKAPGDVK
ncbi:hypothetical protein FOZ63_028434 [Perkinsus olseni]|uniref:Uncharacterized protein n=1 Tax=Perkinsus olseni TaxID=32597 RepID=A0A7J6SEI6_PEROL|nr:hypothetical protein FOZ63_028434 [Perkinsus olseni]KAF4749532.1 hypothetical protein FOZ62_025406 [Perkinsus olseni]